VLIDHPDRREPRNTSQGRQSGFTLLEIILVMAIMGSIASVILPNIGLTVGSRMSMSIREIAGTLRSTYDNSVLSGRVNRVVFSLKSGEYWVEAAPPNFSGRPSVQNVEKSAGELRQDDYKARLIEDLEKLFADVRKAGGGNSERSYSVRSILAVQRNVLKEKKWEEVEDAILTRRRLPSGLVFWSIATEGMPRALTQADLREGELAYVYFFPWGEAIRAQIQIATQAEEGGGIDDKSPKNTLSLDALSGQCSILDGLQEADFIRER
jgi:prepilin-type N-terminal cleavage/methylation domain-containing protein